jgi:hypothetical protein
MLLSDANHLFVDLCARRHSYIVNTSQPDIFEEAAVKTNNRLPLVCFDQCERPRRLASEARMSSPLQRGRARLDLNRRSGTIVVLRGRRPASASRRTERIIRVPLLCMFVNGRAAGRISVPTGGNHRS